MKQKPGKSSGSGSLRSMTGFSTAEGEIAGVPVRIEIRTLNHRFMDLKTRLPREFSTAEHPLRSLLQKSFSRGSIELRMEKIQLPDEESRAEIQLNRPLARSYFNALREIQREFGLEEPVRASEILSFPDVISSGDSVSRPEEIWNSLQPLAQKAIDHLQKMREHEGNTLRDVLLRTISEMSETLGTLRKLRSENVERISARTREKISAVFEAHPLKDTSARDILDSRIAQELALILDRTDIEEELSRFEGHLDHFRKTLNEGGVVGRKLEFILQEMNRELNTLANKAQDYLSSEEAVQAKVRLEQLREQVMNIE